MAVKRELTLVPSVSCTERDQGPERREDEVMKLRKVISDSLDNSGATHVCLVTSLKQESLVLLPEP